MRLFIIAFFIAVGCTKSPPKDAALSPEVDAGQKCDLAALRDMKTNFAFISYSYCVVLGRPADDDGRKFWMNTLAVKNDRLALFQAFTASDEFARATYKGKTLPQLGDDDYIAFLFKRFLNREPKVPEIRALQRERSQGKLNRLAIAQNLVKSREARELHHL